MFNYLFRATATEDPKFKKCLKPVPEIGFSEAEIANLGARRESVQLALKSIHGKGSIRTKETVAAWGELVAAFEQYLPYLEGLRKVLLKAQEQKLKVTHNALEFTWTAILSRGHNKPKISIDSIHWEVTYAYMSYAFALSNLATHLLAFADSVPSPATPTPPAARISGNTDTATPEARYNRAAELLLKSASIFHYVEEKALPLWINFPSNRPVEVLPGVPKALSLICLANATRVAVQKSLITSIPSIALCTKLMADVSLKYKQAQTAMATELSSRDRDGLSTELTKWCQEWAGRVGQAEMERWASAEAGKSNQVGLALGRAKSSLSKFRSAIADSGSTPQVRVYLEGQASDMESVVRSFERENDTITFQPEVNDQVEPLPKALYVMPEYSPPEPACGI